MGRNLMLQTPRFGVRRSITYFTCFVLAYSHGDVGDVRRCYLQHLQASLIKWRCSRCSEMPSPTSPNISGKISFLYIMKSFSHLLVLSSSSVNLYGMFYEG